MTDEPREPLIAKEHAAAAAALLTAAGGLLLYSLAQVRHIDERLDLLEQEARILLDGTGAVRPSKEAMQSYFAVEHLKERVSRLEDRSKQ